MSLMLLLLICFKTVTPVVLLGKAVLKEISAETDTDNKVEKKAENDSSSEKNDKYASIYTSTDGHLRYFAQVAHLTFYSIDYETSHYLEVTTPPPNFILHNTL